MPSEYPAEGPVLMDWPAHWDGGELSHPYGLVEPAARKLFLERLQVMRAVLANTYKCQGLSAAEVIKHRLYHSRSARIGAAIEADGYDEADLTDFFRDHGASHLTTFPVVEAPPDIWLEGLIHFDCAKNGEVLHVEREIAAFGVGLYCLDIALELLT